MVVIKRGHVTGRQAGIQDVRMRALPCKGEAQPGECNLYTSNYNALYVHSSTVLSLHYTHITWQTNKETNSKASIPTVICMHPITCLDIETSIRNQGIDYIGDKFVIIIERQTTVG